MARHRFPELVDDLFRYKSLSDYLPVCLMFHLQCFPLHMYLYALGVCYNRSPLLEFLPRAERTYLRGYL